LNDFITVLFVLDRTETKTSYFSQIQNPKNPKSKNPKSTI
jgi:hypothetical protein